MSERGRTGKMRSFWEKVHVVVENMNNENITYKVKPERDTDGRIRVLHRNMLLSCDNLFDNFNWNIKTQPIHKKQNKKTRQMSKNNDNEEECVTENEDNDSETGEMTEFTPREIQIFSKENSGKIEKKKKEGQKVNEKVDFSIELEKSGQELPREKVVRSKGNEKMIVIDDGSEYCETEGRKMEDKNQGGIKRNKEKPGRNKKVIAVTKSGNKQL